MQDTILSHDEDMIADFTDDIDTLLVFVSTKYLQYLDPISFSEYAGGSLLGGAHSISGNIHSLPLPRRRADRDANQRSRRIAQRTPG